MPYLLREVKNALVRAQMALQGTLNAAANYAFASIDQIANPILIHKTIPAQAAIHTVEKALEGCGRGRRVSSIELSGLILQRRSSDRLTG